MNACNSMVGRFAGHNFEPRYSVEERKSPPLSDFGMFVTAEQIKQPQDLYRKTYHGDVCTRCGATANVPE
jgi:hypothetical protein